MSQEKKHTYGLPSGTERREFEHIKEKFQERSEVQGKLVFGSCEAANPLEQFQLA